MFYFVTLPLFGAFEFRELIELLRLPDRSELVDSAPDDTALGGVNFDDDLRVIGDSDAFEEADDLDEVCDPFGEAFDNFDGLLEL